MRAGFDGLVFVVLFLMSVGASAPALAQTNTADEAASLLSQATEFGRQRKFSDAVAAAERAIAIYRDSGAPGSSLAEAYGVLGRVSFQSQDFRRSATALEQQVSILEGTSGRDLAYLRALGDLANAKRGLGLPVDAKELFGRVLDLQRTLLAPDDFALAETQNNLASLLDSLGDRQQAEALFTDAIAIYERRAERELDDQTLVTKAVVLNNLGLLYFRALEFDKAEQPLRQSLELRQRVSTDRGSDPAVARALNNLALVYQEIGKLDEAKPLYEAALAIFDAVPNPPQTTLASTLNNVAMIHLLSGRMAEAEATYSRALSIRESVLGERHPDVAKTLETIAVFDQVAGRADAALSTMERATAIHEDNLQSVLMSGSDQQRQAYMSTVQENFDIALSMRAAMFAARDDASSWAATLVMRRKGRVLDAATTMTNRLSSRMTPDERQLFDRLAALRGQLAALVLQSTAAPAGERDATRRKLETDIDALETSLAARSRDFAAALRPIDEQAVRGQLPAGTVLIEFVRYRPFDPKAIARTNRFGAPRYAAFVMSRSTVPRWFELGPAEPIERNIRTFRDGLRVPSSSTRQSRGILTAGRVGVGTSGRELGRLLIDPLQAELANADRILVAPDGELSVIPFAALQVANVKQPTAAARYLIEQAEIDYLTSGRDLVSRPERSATSQPALIVANPRFDSTSSTSSSATFQPLAGTADEANALRRLMPGAQVLTGEAATEHALKAASGPRVLHVATHGFFLNAAPATATAGARGGVTLAAVDTESLGRQALLRSGLALAGANQRQGGDGEDGLLTALEAASLDLRGTQLVVLSACDTGLGEVRSGDGVYGLRRALTIAGAESQVMSLWQVSDRATRDLMIAYYTQLSKGAGRAAALRNVQLDLLKSREWSHPYYWAAFVVAGAWEPLRE